jgi:hypothetical protein
MLERGSCTSYTIAFRRSFAASPADTSCFCFLLLGDPSVERCSGNAGLTVSAAEEGPASSGALLLLACEAILKHALTPALPPLPPLEAAIAAMCGPAV